MKIVQLLAAIKMPYKIKQMKCPLLFHLAVLTLYLGLGQAANIEIPATSTTNFEGREYYLITKQLSWQAADASCRQYGTTLASASSPKVYQMLVNFVQSQHTSFWIGGSRTANKGWVWTENGQPVGPFAWSEGKPEPDYSQNCMIINYYQGGGGDNSNCDFEDDYLCVSHAHSITFSIFFISFSTAFPLSKSLLTFIDV